MMKPKTSEEIQKGIVLDGMKAVGHGLGIHATKPAIKNSVKKNMHLVDYLLQVAFSKRITSADQNKRVIELAGMGAIALYTFYQGIERKNKSLLIQGAFLGAALITVSLASSTSHRKLVYKR